MDLLLRSPIIEIVDEALGLDNIEWGKGQIAIRRSRNFPREIPPEPHLDGFASGLNGLEESYCPGRRIPHPYFATVCGELYSVARLTL
jgi:hypothetical protein